MLATIRSVIRINRNRAHFFSISDSTFLAEKSAIFAQIKIRRWPLKGNMSLTMSGRGDNPAYSKWICPSKVDKFKAFVQSMIELSTFLTWESLL